MPNLRAGFRFLSGEARTLERAVSILALSALVSSLLALLRDRLLAHSFGAGPELDMYYAAFRVPDLLFVVFGALVSVYILIPEFTKRSIPDQKKYIDTIVAGFSILAVVVSAGAALAAPFLLSTLFPSFEGERLESLIAITRILLLQPILLGLSNILAAITQVRARYGLYALSPILYNFGIIFGILFLYPWFGFPGLAWGVVIGAFLHFAIQIPPIIQEGFLRRLPLIVEPLALWRTVTISIPRALALSLNQVALIGLTALAALLSPGSIAVFMFAYNLSSVPLAVIGSSYSVAAFPTLAAALSNGKKEEFVQHVSIAARHVLFWSLPVIGLILILRAHIVRVVLGSGEFDWTDTRLTAAALAIFSFGLAAQGLTLLLVRAYYAAGHTGIPLLVSFISASGMLGLSTLFLGIFENPQVLRVVEILMRVEDIPGTSVLALALAYAMASIGASIVLALHFEYTFGGFLRGVRRPFFESVAAAISGSFGAYITLSIIGPLTLTSTLFSVFLRGFAGGIAGIAVVALMYYLLGNREYRETVAAMRARIWRTEKKEETLTVVASAEDVGPSRPQ